MMIKMSTSLKGMIEMEPFHSPAFCFPNVIRRKKTVSIVILGLVESLLGANKDSNCYLEQEYVNPLGKQIAIQ